MSIRLARILRFMVVMAAILLIFVLPLLAEANDKNQELITASHGGRLKEVKRLLGEGVDVNTRGKSGQTALVMAAMNGHANTVKLLLGNGADINATWPETFVPDIPGGTALMHAAKNGHIEVVRLLLDNGADINANFFGSTALKYSAMNGHVEVVKFLLDKGADVAAGSDRTARWRLPRRPSGSGQNAFGEGRRYKRKRWGRRDTTNRCFLSRPLRGGKTSR